MRGRSVPLVSPPRRQAPRIGPGSRSHPTPVAIGGSIPLASPSRPLMVLAPSGLGQQRPFGAYNSAGPSALGRSDIETLRFAPRHHPLRSARLRAIVYHLARQALCHGAPPPPRPRTPTPAPPPLRYPSCGGGRSAAHYQKHLCAAQGGAMRWGSLPTALRVMRPALSPLWAPALAGEGARAFFLFFMRPPGALALGFASPLAPHALACGSLCSDSIQLSPFPSPFAFPSGLAD